jgi:hypothetical protein
LEGSRSGDEKSKRDREMNDELGLLGGIESEVKRDQGREKETAELIKEEGGGMRVIMEEGKNANDQGGRVVREQIRNI